MVLEIIGTFFTILGSLGLVYSKIINWFKIRRKTQAEYYHEKFIKSTPDNEKRIIKKDFLFAMFFVGGAILLVVGLIFGY